MQHVIGLKKAQPTQDSDGVLTKHGMQIAHDYAKTWLTTTSRNLQLERSFPELEGLFYDIRADADLARRHAA